MKKTESNGKRHTTQQSLNGAVKSICERALVRALFFSHLGSAFGGNSGGTFSRSHSAVMARSEAGTWPVEPWSTPRAFPLGASMKATSARSGIVISKASVLRLFKPPAARAITLPSAPSRCRDPFRRPRARTRRRARAEKSGKDMELCRPSCDRTNPGRRRSRPRRRSSAIPPF